MGERSVRIREVKGSNPSRSIKRRIVLNDTAFLFVLGSCFFNTAAHRDVIQASCYPITSKTNYTTIVFKKFCITTRTRQGRPKPFLEREGFGFFVFGGVPRRTTKNPQRMAGLLQLRRSALRMLIFYAAPPLLMGKSEHRLRFDVICRNTPAFLAPRSGELPGEARLRGFIPPACGRRSAPDRPGCCCPGQICRSGGASSGPAPRTTGLP